MANCQLCKIKVADKKNSHIVPHFLLRRIENIEGKSERGYEIGYLIGPLVAESHFGRSVQPDRLEDDFGEITDEDISNNKHPLIVDDFFCTECEKRIGQIESKYSEFIDNIQEVNYESGISSTLGILFWASVFWRMSVNGKNGVTLSEEKNESLRAILDTLIPKENEDFDEGKVKLSSLIEPVSYKILRCYNLETEDPKWLLMHPDFHDSSCLFIGDFIVAFSMYNNFREFETNECFGSNKLVLDAPVNHTDGKEIIKPFHRDDFINFKNNFTQKKAESFTKNLYELFDRIHVLAGGKGTRMPERIKREIMLEITSDEKKIGRKYSEEEIARSVYKIISKYAL